MESFTWYQLVFAGLAALGGFAGIIGAAKFVTERIDKRKQENIAERAKAITDAVELKRIIAEDDRINDEAIKKAIWDLLEATKKELADKKIEIIELLHVQSLSRPIVMKIHAQLRAIRKQVDIIDTLIMKGTQHADLTAEVEILRQNLDRLEESVP